MGVWVSGVGEGTAAGEAAVVCNPLGRVRCGNYNSKLFNSLFKVFFNSSIEQYLMVTVNLG